MCISSQMHKISVQERGIKYPYPTTENINIWFTSADMRSKRFCNLYQGSPLRPHWHSYIWFSLGVSSNVTTTKIVSQHLPLTERFHLQICLVFQRVSALTRVSHFLESCLVDSWICLDSRSATASTALPCLLLLTYKKKTCQPKVFLLMYRTYNLFKEKVSGFLVVYFVDYTNFNESLRMQPLELNRHRP